MILKQHYGIEGPLGFPQTDEQARALEGVLKELPAGDEFRYRKFVMEDGPSEILKGDRTDVSWISTEDPDRVREVVIAKGMNDRQFAVNPIVTLNHCYTCPPVGKSLWRKRVRDGERIGIKAKTRYPARPDAWPEDVWPSDAAFALVQAGLLRGKSIGFLPVKVHVPTDEERNLNGWSQVRLVIDEWILLEYACVFLPAQQHALVEEVSKSGTRLPEAMCQAMGIEVPRVKCVPCLDIPCVEIDDVMASIDLPSLVRECVASNLDRLRGRV